MKTPAPPPVACRHAGFTLIELMVVILLAAILLVLAMPTFNATLQRYRVSMAASQIANALQFARAEAIRTRQNVIVRQTGTLVDCTPTGDATDWHCGVDVAAATAGVQPLKTIPASSLNAVKVSMGNPAAPRAGGADDTLTYTFMGYTTCAGCTNNTPSGADSFIYIWPTALGDDPAAAPVVSTVCAAIAGKVRVVSSYAATAADCK